jgi:hypothetical protein
MVVKKKDEKLRELTLSDDVNDLDLQDPHPKTEVRLGLKSRERLDQIEKQRVPQQVVDIPQFIADMARLRRTAEERAAANRIEWEQRRATELAEKRQQERDAAVKLMLETESSVHRDRRLLEIKVRDESREREIKQLHNRQQREFEKIELLFNISPNKFNSKYEHVELDNVGAISRIISSRKFSSGRFGEGRLAYKCAVCPFEESLALRTILWHIYTSQGTLHKDRVLDLINSEYRQLETQKRFEWNRLDNDPEYHARIAREELEAISKVKARSPENISGYRFTKKDSDKQKVRGGFMSQGEFDDKWGEGN